MEQKLDLILQKLEVLDTRTSTLESGQKELFGIVNAILHRQDETDAKLDGMALDMHKMQGDVTALKEQVTGTLQLKDMLNKVVNRVDDMELDLKILKKVITS